MIYPIVKYGQPVLEKRGEDITEFDTPELHQLIEDMFESMYAAKGVGLAAPQIGFGKRLAVIDITTGEDPAQKIVLEDPRSSTPGLGFLLWMKSIYGDKAGEAWTKLKPRILTTAPGWSEAYALFTKGEAPMVLSYTTSPAYHIAEEKSSRYQAANQEGPVSQADQR
jgi:hypothetical protein